MLLDRWRAAVLVCGSGRVWTISVWLKSQRAGSCSQGKLIGLEGG